MNIQSRIARVASVYQDVGLREFALRVVRKLDGGRGILSRKARAYTERKAAVDQAFDGNRHVDTGGIQHLYDLTIDGPNARYGTSHIASDPGEFALAVESVGIDYARYSFVDLGSGKGRAVMLASTYPFERLIGVEFAAELHRVAEANIAAMVAEGGLAPGRVELVHADATCFEFPITPLLVFLFHPFQAEVMRRVAEHLLESWRAAPRPVSVLYVNPVYGDVWTEAGWRLVGQEHYHRIYGPPAD